MIVIVFAYVVYLVLFGVIYAIYRWLSDRRKKTFIIAAGLGVVFATFAGTPPSATLLAGQAAALVSIVAFARWRASNG